MTADHPIHLALSTDSKGHSYHATLIASILRRTERPVHVRCWCRGFLPESFETGRLKVEFLPAVEEVTGRYPGTSGPCAYDRLLVIRDCSDWDRCMVMDYDQLALCDMGPLMDLDMGDHLLAAHMQGPGVDMAYAMRVWLKRPMPEGWDDVATHPYFLMPPLMNLKAMREAGTWENFLAAHAAFGADEQLSLTAATEGRTLPLEAKWNLFPRLHIREGEAPEGIIHWSGWPKPWHKGAKVWRPDIWESEKSSWEHLRMGLWQKPLAIELEPEDPKEVRALLERGWRVVVGLGPKTEDRETGDRRQEGPRSHERGYEETQGDGASSSAGTGAATLSRARLRGEDRAEGGDCAGSGATSSLPDFFTSSLSTRGCQVRHKAENLGLVEFPDLRIVEVGAGGLADLLEGEGGEADMVRFGMWSELDEWLEGIRVLPKYLLLNGARSAAEVDRARRWGYDLEASYVSESWPRGGPLPRALDFHPPAFGTGLGGGEVLVMQRGEATAVDGRLACGPRPVPVKCGHGEKVGVMVFATGMRRRLLGTWLVSVRRNFMPGMLEKVFIFTDGKVDTRGIDDLVEVIPVPWHSWRELEMSRYGVLAQHGKAGRFDGLTHLFLLGPDLRVVGEVGSEAVADGLIGVAHAGFHQMPREKFTYETRLESAARVGRHEGERYYTGMVQGGARDAFLAAVETMAGAIERDGAKGIKAVWRAESHWNRVLVDMTPALVLDPGYGRPKGQATAFPAKILAPSGGSDVEDARWRDGEFPEVIADRNVHCGPVARASRGEQGDLSRALAEITGWIGVISLPKREDRRRELQENWEPHGLRWEWLDGVRPDRGDIRWKEIRDMEAYGCKDGLRKDYVIGAVGCKRAGIAALRAFLATGEETGLICQDDCRWLSGAGGIVGNALRELPDDWEMLYFSASAREPHVPHTAHLVRLGGARLCTAILWRRATVERLLPELEECGCEWDLFMQRSHARTQAYCVVPMPAYQGRSHSDIVGGVVQPANV